VIEPRFKFLPRPCCNKAKNEVMDFVRFSSQWTSSWSCTAASVESSPPFRQTSRAALLSPVSRAHARSARAMMTWALDRRPGKYFFTLHWVPLFADFTTASSLFAVVVAFKLLCAESQWVMLWLAVKRTCRQGSSHRCWWKPCHRSARVRHNLRGIKQFS